MREPRHRRLGGLAAAAAGLGAAAAMVLAMAPAHAGPATIDAQLSLSGVATVASPTGGTTVGLHPGDSVRFTAASAPTAGLSGLGLGALAGTAQGLLNTLATFQVSADFSGLPGGTAHTTLSGSRAATFTFAHAGTYTFTWSAQSVSPLGSQPIQLDGGQLAAAGVRLNAHNQYVGRVTVATNPPAGGLSGQLPGLGLGPSAAGLGQLPALSLLALPAPTLPVPAVALPSLPLPGSGNSPASRTAPAGALPGWTPPALTVPQQVVPSGYGAGADGGTAAGGTVGGTVGGLAGPLGSAHAGGSASPTAQSSATPAPPATSASGTDAVPAPVKLSARTTSGGGQSMPVLLAIIAIIALSLVTALYARVYLLREK